MWVRAIVALVVAIAGLLGISQSPLARKQPPSGPDWTRYDQKTARIIRVVDGDTVDVDLPDQSSQATRIRLLGIDAPEMPDAHFAARAKEYVAARTRDQVITIRLDEIETRERDKHGRLLAYLYLPNNECLNESLIRDGMAYAFRSFPHQFSAQFEAAERSARSGRIGLWKDVSIEQMPAWRQDWMKQNGITTP